MRGTRRAASALVVAMALVACGGDDGGQAAPSSTGLPPPDTGVRLPDIGPGSGSAPGGPEAGAPPSVDLAVDELPAGWPDDFPIPEGAVIDLGSSTRIDGTRVLAGQLVVGDTSPAAIVEGYLEALDGDGYTLLRDRTTGTGGSAQGTLTFETKDYVGDVLAVTGDAATVALTLTATFPPS
jgi:hypothetical protein